MILKRAAQQGMRVLTGDPKKVKALDAQGNVVYVDDPEMGHDVPQDDLDIDLLKRGISMAESLGGVLMMNPESVCHGTLWTALERSEGYAAAEGLRQGAICEGSGEAGRDIQPETG